MKKYGGKRREKSKMEIGYVVLDLNPQLCCSTRIEQTLIPVR